ncbi:TonB-dependent receptor, partial [Sphingobacterium spiritivorum ATCC 33300]
FASFGMYQASYATNPTWDPDNGTAYDINGAGTGVLPSGYRRVQQANPDLRWESATQHNIGIDFGFFNQKLTGSFDYFKKQTEDILISPPFIAALGEGGNRWVNGASMSNKGYEVLLSYASSHSDWKYSITGNIAGYRNKIVKLPEDVINSYPGNGVDQTILNRPLNSMFGYVADGLFKTEEEVSAHAEQVGKGLGRIRYKDINQDGRIGDEDRTWLGISDPDFIYGINLSVGYKQWDFSMFWNGVYGGLVNNTAKGYTDFISFFGGENYGTRVLDAWSAQNPQSDIPALSFNDLNNEKRFSSYVVESASYFKLRTLELGYSLSPKALQRIKSQGIRLYILGENLLSFKKTRGNNKYTGVDPETPNSGYPIPFSITAGINVSF